MTSPVTGSTIEFGTTDSGAPLASASNAGSADLPTDGADGGGPASGLDISTATTGSIDLQFLTGDTTGANIAMPGFPGDAALFLSGTGNVINSFEFDSNDGTDFALTSFEFSFSGAGPQNVTITALDDGGSVGTATIANAATGTIHTVQSGDFTTAPNSIDEFRVTFTSAVEAVGIDDILLGAAVGGNTAPALGGTPADDTVTEDVATAIDLSAYNIADVDGDTITLTLAVDRGTIASADGNGTFGGVTIAQSGTTSMTLQGTVANLNTYLDDTSHITFTTDANDTTAATLTVTPNDGTVDGTADTVTLNVTAVNDAPTVTGAPSDITVTQDTSSNVDLSNIDFADVDSATVTVTLEVDAGSFATPADGAGVGGGVTETKVSATKITLQGAPDDIDTYLDTASNIKYTGANGVSGDDAATLTISASDGALSLAADPTVNIDITALVNAAPVLANLDATPSFTEGGSAVVLDADVVVSDTELDALNGAAGNYNGASLTIARNGGANSDDDFGFNNAGGVTLAGSNLQSGGQTFATFNDDGNGTLTINFTSAGTNATSALVDTVLQNITYSNGNDSAAPANVQLDWTFSDGTDTDTGNVTVSISEPAPPPTPPAAPSLPPPIATQFSVPSFEPLEPGDTATGRLLLGSGATGAVEVTPVATNLVFEATGSSEQVVTFNTGDSLKTFTVRALDSAVGEAASVRVSGISVLSPDDRVSLPNGNANFGTIQESQSEPQPAFSISLGDAALSFVEGEVGSFTIAPNQAPSQPVTVELAAPDGVVLSPASLEFLATNGTESQSVEVFIANAARFRDQALPALPTGEITVSFQTSDADFAALTGPDPIPLSVQRDTVAPLIGNLDGDSVTEAVDNIATVDQGTPVTINDLGLGLGPFSDVGGDAPRLIVTNSGSTSIAQPVDFGTTSFFSGDEVTVDGVTIGTVVEDGQGGDDLVIELAATATEENVAAFINQLRLFGELDPGEVTLTITVEDGNFNASDPATVTINFVEPTRLIVESANDGLSFFEQRDLFGDQIASFRVSLSGPPTEDVEVQFPTSLGSGFFLILDEPLFFTSENATAPQFVAIGAGSSADVEEDTEFVITPTVTGSDGTPASIIVDPVILTIKDDDIPPSI